MKGHLSGNLVSGKLPSGKLPAGKLPSGKFRRVARETQGATMIEFAFIFPIVLMLTFGILEISLCMASLVTLEGDLKQASRYGITSQPQGGLNADQRKLVPISFKKTPENPRLEMIGVSLNQNT